MFVVPLLLAAGVFAAPPQHVETTTSPAPSEASTTVAAIITTAAPAVPSTALKVDVVEDIITGFTETPVDAPTTAAPVASTAAPVFTTPTPIQAVPSTTTPPPPPPPTKPPRMSGKEREALIAHLGNIDLRNTDKLVLTPRQRLAIALELEYQQLGLQPFQDPTPWQRLSREEQQLFNEKYLALAPAIQEFAKAQFTSLSEERQEHAFNMFLNLDLETLTSVISRELQREQEAKQAAEAERRRQQLERQRQEEARRQFELEQQRRRAQEVPRNQGGNRFSNFQQQQPQQQFQQQQFQQQQFQQFQQPQQAAPQFNQQSRLPNNFDPRRRQPQPQQQFQQQPQQQFQFQQQSQQQFQQPRPQPTAAELRHLAQAEAQIQEAVALQACLSNPSGPGCGK